MCTAIGLMHARKNKHAKLLAPCHETRRSDLIEMAAVRLLAQ